MKVCPSFLLSMNLRFLRPQKIRSLCWCSYFSVSDPGQTSQYPCTFSVLLYRMTIITPALPLTCFICVCVCVCMQVCMYVCMYVCVCMHIVLKLLNSNQMNSISIFYPDIKTFLYFCYKL